MKITIDTGKWIQQQDEKELKRKVKKFKVDFYQNMKSEHRLRNVSCDDKHTGVANDRKSVLVGHIHLVQG